VEVLRSAMKKCETNQIVDICSGAGGPTPQVLRTLNAGLPSAQFKATLTDLYPVPHRWEVLAKASDGAITYSTEPCDAMALPETLKGFRTMYLSLHHFKPADAKGIIRDAIRRRQGIAIFELQARTWKSIIDILVLVPLVSIFLSPFIAPFSLARIFFHTIFPVIPFILVHDGIISSLRSYSRAECEEFVQQLRVEEPGLGVDEYSWEFKKIRCGLFNLVELYTFVGIPRMPAQ